MKNWLSLNQLKPQIQKALFMIKELVQIKKNSLSKPRNNRFNFKWTDFFLDRLTKIP